MGVAALLFVGWLESWFCGEGVNWYIFIIVSVLAYFEVIFGVHSSTREDHRQVTVVVNPPLHVRECCSRRPVCLFVCLFVML